MERIFHSMRHLFQQLGKPCDDEAILKFIESHTPLSGEMKLHEASFWTTAQACFLYESIDEDADWAVIADSLNTQLRSRV